MLIAATAAHHNLTVATRNIKDFRGCGLRLFDPFQNDYV
jgi:predicted nucleic acid-binding protein